VGDLGEPGTGVRSRAALQCAALTDPVAIGPVQAVQRFSRATGGWRGGLEAKSGRV